MKSLARLLFVFSALISFVLLLTFPACLPSVTVDKQYFQLHLTPDASVVTGEKTTPAIDKVLLVDTVEVEEIYNDYRVVYRTSPHHLNYYAYNYWIKKPEKVIKDCIVDYLSKTKHFKKVITGFKEGEPDLLLKAKVHVLEEYDRPEIWYAHLKMDIEIRDFKSDQRVLFHSFDKQQQLTQRKVELLPAAISRILKEELDEVLNASGGQNPFSL